MLNDSMYFHVSIDWLINSLGFFAVNFVKKSLRTGRYAGKRGEPNFEVRPAVKFDKLLSSINKKPKVRDNRRRLQTADDANVLEQYSGVCGDCECALNRKLHLGSKQC